MNVCPIQSTWDENVECQREDCAWWIPTGYINVIHDCEGTCCVPLIVRTIMKEVG